MGSATKGYATRIKELESVNASLQNTNVVLSDKNTTLANELSVVREKSEQIIKELQNKNMELEEKYKLLQHLHFGKKSERLVADENQLRLFDEAEAGADASGTKVDLPQPKSSTTVVREHTKKRGRKSLPADLPREEILHDLSPEQKSCPCCGKQRPAIGDERTEELHIVPEKASIRVHVRKKYGACSCEAFEDSEHKAVITAPGEAKIIPGSSFSNQAIALILVWKYVDGLPLYRIEKILERSGVTVPRATLCNLVIGANRALGDLIDAMWRDVRGSPVINMDETTVQVLKEPGRPPEAKSYMWVTSGYRDNRPIVLFHYHPTRGKIVPETSLAGFSGFLQTDGYEAYNAACAKLGIKHVGCWAHIRREFFEASKIAGNSENAEKMLTRIRALYDIERQLRNKLDSGEINPDTFVAERQAATKPEFEKIWAMLLTLKAEVLPGVALGKAVNYAINQFEKAVRYVEHHLLTPDNNLIENAIRPFVIGRKNWMFSDTPLGCHASAGIYSVIETLKKNGHDPYHGLCHIFKELSGNPSAENVQRLLPYILQPNSY